MTQTARKTTATPKPVKSVWTDERVTREQSALSNMQSELAKTEAKIRELHTSPAAATNAAAALVVDGLNVDDAIVAATRSDAMSAARQRAEVLRQAITQQEGRVRVATAAVSAEITSETEAEREALLVSLVAGQKKMLEAYAAISDHLAGLQDRGVTLGDALFRGVVDDPSTRATGFTMPPIGNARRTWKERRDYLAQSWPGILAKVENEGE